VRYGGGGGWNFVLVVKRQRASGHWKFTSANVTDLFVPPLDPGTVAFWPGGENALAWVFCKIEPIGLFEQ
jgi:hypothetical protein